MIVTVSAYHGRGVYELDGNELRLKEYEAAMSPEASEDAQKVIAFQAAMDTLACRLRWHGAPARVSA